MARATSRFVWPWATSSRISCCRWLSVGRSVPGRLSSAIVTALSSRGNAPDAPLDDERIIGKIPAPPCDFRLQGGPEFHHYRPSFTIVLSGKQTGAQTANVILDTAHRYIRC